MAEVLTISNFINGQFVPTPNYLESVNPATGQVWARVPDSQREDINAAVAAAKEAFPKWSATSVAERSAVLRRIADLIEANLDELALLETTDQGKPLWLSKSVDIPRAVLNFRHFATSIQNDVEMSTVAPEAGIINYTVHEPIGVAGIITPWNLPLYLLTFKLAPALAYGNTVVAKPSEMTSMTAYKLCSLLREAGLPPGVVNMVFGFGQSVGEALVSHPDVPIVSFTGGTQTGTHISQSAAPFAKKVSLEMGGKNPAIVFKDANLGPTVTALIRASFINQGEVCLCSSRIYVEREIFDTFVDSFVTETKKLKLGDPLHRNTFIGPLISRQHLEKVKGYVDSAKAEGATIHCGASYEVNLSTENKGGFYYPPTVITNTEDSSPCMREEIFGPVVCVVPFDAEEEAVRRANDSQYGLCATVWTQDVNKLHRVAHQLRVGTVWANCWLLRDLHMPFGGTKMSGIGREGTFDSRDFYTETKTICIKLDQEHD